MLRSRQRARSLRVGKFLGIEQLECRAVLNGGSFCDVPLQQQQYTDLRPDPVPAAPAQVTQANQVDCGSVYSPPLEPEQAPINIASQQFTPPVDHAAPATYSEVLIIR